MHMMLSRSSRSLRASLVAAALLAGCTHARPNATAATAPPVVPARADFLHANMDTTVDPGVDFFEYANGG